uniref:CTD nuclear envelope phosphatase 1 n=1 Tax=Accipiter nisus TaxID=211598 RepID=A0A8B9MRV2_9AVES
MMACCGPPCARGPPRTSSSRSGGHGAPQSQSLGVPGAGVQLRLPQPKAGGAGVPLTHPPPPPPGRHRQTPRPVLCAQAAPCGFLPGGGECPTPCPALGTPPRPHPACPAPPQQTPALTRPQVSQWYELVVFTASMEIYGCAVADKLDNNRSILNRRYYRQHCTLELGSYIKDLSVVHSDLSSIIILDNSPGAYRSHPDNAIPIKSWFSDPSDTALLNLLPMLDALRFTADVRSVLSRNLHQHRLW